MQVGHFPASAANSLIQGYCDDFVSLAAILAQTLEQVSMRGIAIAGSRPALVRIENGMRNLAEAIHELLERGKVSTELSNMIGKEPPPAPAGAPPTAPAAPASAAASKTEKMARPATGLTASGAPATASPATPLTPLKPGLPATPSTPSTRMVVTGPPGTAQRPKATPPAQPPLPAPPAARSAQALPAHPTTPPTATRPPAQSAPPPAPAPRIAPPTATETLKGTNHSMPLLSVFQFLGRMRKQGTLHVATRDERMAFDVQSGCILATSSDHCPADERLGELLIEMGACTREQIDDLLSRVDSGSHERFGKMAIRAGIVGGDHVNAALELQVRRRLNRACKAPEASYEFVEGARSAAESHQFRVAPVAIV